MGIVKFNMKLFIAGKEPNSGIAYKNLQDICSGDYSRLCNIEVVDVFENFELALGERIIVTPTLIIETSDLKFRTRFFGNLHEKNEILKYLNGIE
jgi:circadian clock protein KaiB